MHSRVGSGSGNGIEVGGDSRWSIEACQWDLERGASGVFERDGKIVYY